jgi:hypothetical protein
MRRRSTKIPSLLNYFENRKTCGGDVLGIKYALKFLYTIRVKLITVAAQYKP